MAAQIPRLSLALLPALLFLAGLVAMDSYKLVSVRRILAAIAAGCGSSLIAAGVHSWLAGVLPVSWPVYTRYIAPPIEEILKSLYLLYLVRTNRVGFMVDAAILGFAVGAGFALVENLYYLSVTPNASPYLWVIRGFGTAFMHGGVTAVVGILMNRFGSGPQGHPARAMIPGLIAATAVHSLFNHFFLNPLLSTLFILLILPGLAFLVYRKSEAATRRWLGIGFDSDQELMGMITTGILAENPVGQYLQSVEDRFPGEVAADMLCYLRLHLELSIRAKGLLMMREAGFDVTPDPEVREQFAELSYLERSIGATGKMALHPFLHTRARDLWQIHMLRV